MFSLICFILLSHSIFATSTSNVTSLDDEKISAAPKPKSIFILAGQSNMAGRGGVINGVFDKVIPHECKPNPRILRLNAGLKWEQARDPLHKDVDLGKDCGVGPGMPFANSVLERDSSIGVIGLVPCAIGGTKLSAWAAGGKLYNNMLKRARAAVRAGGGQIRGILWYQGESDTVVKQDATSYKERWEKLFTQLRSDLESPMLPVVHVIIRSHDVNGTYLDLVRKSQQKIDLPNVKHVDSLKMELKGDNVHLTTPGEVELGKTLADAFLEFAAPPVQNGTENLDSNV